MTVNYLEPDVIDQETEDEQDVQENISFRDLDYALGKPSVEEVRSLLLYSALKELYDIFRPSISEIYAVLDDIHNLSEYTTDV
jgi:hypothetical protein